MNWLTAYEGRILIFIQDNIRSDFLDPIFNFITSLGNAGLIWIVLSILLMIPRKTRRTGITCAVALILSLLVNNCTIKPLVARARPYDVINGLTTTIKKPVEYSFPSGHTASSFAAAFVMFKMLPKLKGILAITLAGLISLSRLYVGVHYPTDVIFGILSGILLALLAIYIVNKADVKWRQKNGKHNSDKRN